MMTPGPGGFADPRLNPPTVDDFTDTFIPGQPIISDIIAIYVPGHDLCAYRVAAGTVEGPLSPGDLPDSLVAAVVAQMADAAQMAGVTRSNRCESRDRNADGILISARYYHQ